jgi:hypothetical protein
VHGAPRQLAAGGRLLVAGKSHTAPLWRDHSHPCTSGDHAMPPGVNTKHTSWSLSPRGRGCGS